MNYVLGALILGFAVCCVLIPFTDRRPAYLYAAIGFSVAFVLVIYGRLMLWSG